MEKIYLGEQNKHKIIEDFILKNDVDKIWIFGDDIDINFENKEHISFTNLIMYKYYYRLLQEINTKTLVVINECLKRTNRYELTYNCIRRYLMNKPHRIVFNYLPIKENEEDFAILYDFTLDNPFLKDKYEWITDFSNVIVGNIDIEFKVEEVKLSDIELEQYQNEKQKVIDSVKNNADIIPIKLLSFSEKLNQKYVKKCESKRHFKAKMQIAVNQTKVDKYYYEKLQKARESVYACLQRIQGR